MWQIQIKQRQLSTQHVGKRWDALLQDVEEKISLYGFKRQVDKFLEEKILQVILST